MTATSQSSTEHAATIFAGNKRPLPSTEHSLARPKAVAAGVTRPGECIARNAREQLMARKQGADSAGAGGTAARSGNGAACRQHVLKEDPNLVSVDTLQASLRKSA